MFGAGISLLDRSLEKLDAKNLLIIMSDFSKLTQIVEKAAKSETFAKFGETYGFAPLWINGADFEKMIRAELDTNRKIKAKYIDK